jgi:hypothetical protein
MPDLHALGGGVFELRRNGSQCVQPAQLEALQAAHDEPTLRLSSPSPPPLRPKKPDMIREVCFEPQLTHAGCFFACARLTINSNFAPQSPHSYS